MVAGLTQLKELEKIHAWQRLEEIGSMMEAGVKEIARKTGRDMIFNRIGSMFCLYFTEEPVHHLDDAKKSDTEAFKRYFHKALELGVYFAPSPYEAGFISMAHSQDDIDATLDICRTALRHALT